jgi:GTPase SAR1 family protein
MITTFFSKKTKKNNFFVIFLFLSIVSFILFCDFSYSQNLTNPIIIRTIENKKIIFDSYKMQSPQEIDISDLTIWNKINESSISRREIFNTFYNEGYNYRIFLLRKGYAKLDKPELANAEEVKAQNYARDNNLNIWEVATSSSATPSPSSSPENPFDNQLRELLRNISNFWMPITIFMFVAVVYLFLVSTAAKVKQRQVEIKLKEAENKQKEAENKQKEAENKQKEAEKKLVTIRNYAKEIDRTEYIYQDVVLLGSRHCGKTSLAKLWCAPWTNIHSIQSTDSWETSEFDLFQLENQKKHDPRFGVDTGVKKVLRLKIHDYPGEDLFRDKAISDLKNLSNAVILLVFDLETKDGNIPENYSKNNSYYSQVFMNLMRNNKHLNESVMKVFVVFNKIDLLSDQWKFDHITQTLKETNAAAINNIESIFSPNIDYHAVSAENNKWLISLFGKILEVTKQKHKIDDKKITELLRKLSEEIK